VFRRATYYRIGTNWIIYETLIYLQTMRETITLQLGGYSNYVGMHYWNYQEELLDAGEDMDSEEYEHERLFRSGRDSTDRSSLKPRVLVSDLAQNLGQVMFERKGGAGKCLSLGGGCSM